MIPCPQVGAGRMCSRCIRKVMSARAMGLLMRNGNGRRGYTLIEMIIVMAIISVLVSIAVPMYQKSLLRTKESLLKNNLFTLRTVIDEYTFDKKRAPQTLDDLVSDGYLRAVPIDPITNSSQTWRVVMEDAVSSVDQTMPGIY